MSQCQQTLLANQNAVLMSHDPFFLEKKENRFKLHQISWNWDTFMNPFLCKISSNNTSLDMPPRFFKSDLKYVQTEMLHWNIIYNVIYYVISSFEDMITGTVFEMEFLPVSVISG